jgi:hypothetical protein
MASASACGLLKTQASVGSLVLAIVLAYGVLSLVWMADVTRRVHNQAPKEEIRRSLAGGLAVWLAFVGASHTALFWKLLG